MVCRADRGRRKRGTLLIIACRAWPAGCARSVHSSRRRAAVRRTYGSGPSGRSRCTLVRISAVCSSFSPRLIQATKFRRHAGGLVSARSEFSTNCTFRRPFFISTRNESERQPAGGNDRASGRRGQVPWVAGTARRPFATEEFAICNSPFCNSQWSRPAGGYIAWPNS